ncbi:hypothetical protein HMPREF3034_00510 [Prevotella sp. DNF00663]|uniref:glycosyltransferase n=1 Tax=Prevotella sp. DNF00663 TaxID=1384078 RepID=UPI0007867D70|nr:hypothetical protein [Prevotella sp. DNF00663]KXB84907.1 hypothetical protein HMPREF3034_00510 [Prevotella sp. DNF00663]
MEIVLDPRLKFNYASWYLLGIERFYGKRCIHYDVEPFKNLPYHKIRDYNSGFAFLCKDAKKVVKIFVDTEDVAKVFPERYEWCDIYGMVNPTKKQIETFDKIIAIGPACGVTLSVRIQNIVLSLMRYCQGSKYNSIPYKNYLRDYLYTNIRRRPLESYELPVNIKENYIFHASTLWYNQFAATDTNKYRGEFLKVCQKAGLEIEGGLFYVEGRDVLAEMPDYPKYKEIYKEFIYDKRLSMDDYIWKTKQSVLVFNTPSVCECHGWKLAEYLCMGKAIISTPLKREMPGRGLIHGENVHFVHHADEIYDAVIKISHDKEYRKKLERGARAYYEQWLAPEVVMKRMIDKAFKAGNNFHE